MISPKDFLEFKCLKGLKQKNLHTDQKYLDRLAYELDVISSMGFCEYFLIMADVVRWCRENNNRCGPGRGSAAGCLASYSLGITQIDPLKYGLYFERFLNEGRKGSLCDIDLDVDELKRSEVIEYLRSKYGEECIAHIGTYGTLKAKGAVRVAAKVLGHPYHTGDRISNLVLNPIAGKPQPLSVCYQKVPMLNQIRSSGTAEAEILKIAEEIEDRKRSFGTHASGVIIAPEKMSRILPLSRGKDGVATSQFEMNTVEELGLVKFDFLGLRALTTIQECIRLIKLKHNIDIDIDNIPVDDEKVFKNLQSGDNVGIFQLEASSGLRELLVQVKPTCIEDLSTIISIFRPGPLGSNMIPSFLQVRAEQIEPTYLFPQLKPILSKTGGMIIYQEQIMEICKEIAGYTLSEADIMRKAVGKKINKLMDQQEKKFKDGAAEKGFDSVKINQLWKEIVEFADYGFNKSHGISYSYISYQMSYLKTHYPLEFMCACLTSDGDEKDKVISYINECKRIGIPVLKPDVNKSEQAFTIKDGSIRFGLSSIKYVGSGSAKAIIRERKKSSFKNFLNFTQRIDLSRINKAKLEALVWAGCFDELGHKQEDLLRTIETVCSHKNETKAYESKLETYNKRMERYKERQEEIEKWENMDRKERRGIKRPGKIKLPETPSAPSELTISPGEHIEPAERLNKERELLGFYISGHPLDLSKLKAKHTIQQIKELPSGTTIEVVAIPSVVKELTTKKKTKMAYMDIEDKTGTIQTTVFPKIYAEYGKMLKETIPARFTATVESTEIEDEGQVNKIAKLIIRKVVPDLTLRPKVREQVKRFSIEDIKKLKLEQVKGLIDTHKKISIRTQHNAYIKVV